MNHEGERAPMDLSRAAWRKSSRSNGTGGNCVEVATINADTTVIVVRDSKNPHGPALAFKPGDWRAFVRGIKRGEFDDLV
ncbi:DUF397 domain-containing protein [Thermopolyspora sp. NPDC052614]|uniref:DUF397 domain-containing protein n=1 Tax=Thermopolyspora sp. NPDC052614 TaxID=3155682 RepID=UPI0034256BCC